MRAKTLMVQGTASSVGKSMLVAALCRILRQDGWNVAPFKAQNMSLNSFVTRDGGEIGRAQVVQAEAACVAPTVEMNPILLKPEADHRSQLIVRGRPVGALPADAYYGMTDHLWSVVTESLEALLAEYDFVVIEGAGSPAEVNLKERDLVNMRVARYCQAPVLLVADIDRGGVFASIVGTLELLDPEERALVQAIVINKFRGDRSLLTPGLTWLTQKTGIPVAGVIPYDHDIHLDEEDSMSLEQRCRMKTNDTYVLDIAVLGVPHLANFDDFAPFEQEAGVRLRYVEPNDALDTPDLIILPGTKSTVADLEYLRRIGLAEEVIARAHEGTPVIGICGGYQMLGEWIVDPQHVESDTDRVHGLGLLPGITTFFPHKSTHQVNGRVRQDVGLLRNASGLAVTGYEIHMGQTTSDRPVAPFCIEERSGKPCQDLEGCLSTTGYILGTYLHGLFHNEGLRRAILTELAARKKIPLHLDGKAFSKEDQYNRLAALVRSSLQMDVVYHLIGIV